MAVEVVRRRDEMTGAGWPGAEPYVFEESLGYLVNYVAKAFARALGERLTPTASPPPSGRW